MRIHWCPQMFRNISSHCNLMSLFMSYTETKVLTLLSRVVDCCGANAELSGEAHLTWTWLYGHNALFSKAASEIGSLLVYAHIPK